MSKKYSGSVASRSRRISLVVEACEPRRLLTTFLVTSASDNGDNQNPVPGSLRDEILLSNANPAPANQTNQINFNITGPSTITPTSDLPGISVPTVLDARTQPNTPIVLDGINVVMSNNVRYGLEISGSDSTIEGFTIDRFFGVGIDCIAGVNNQILNNFLGTDPTGESTTNSSGQALGNGDSGIYLSGTSGDLIKGNVISGNTGYGIADSANDNQIVGNKIGTDASGTKMLFGQSGGIDIQSGSGNTVGGTTAGAANVISGNSDEGILIYGSDSLDNVIEGNMIGTDVTGTQPLGNGLGVSNSGTGTTIGGTAAGAGNIISDNIGDGVFVGGSNNVISYNTVDSNGSNGIEGDFNKILGDQLTSLTIQKNLIGTNAEGTVGLGNQIDGILIDNDSVGVLILNNVVAESVKGSGIRILYSDDIDIEGNLIGTDLTGTRNLGNEVDGITLNNSHDVRIYGSVIVGSVTGYGLAVDAMSLEAPTASLPETNGLVIIQDHIGTNLAGTDAIPNALGGVSIVGDPATSTFTPVMFEADLISGNNGIGVKISNVPNVLIENSLIGTNAVASAALPNTGGGLKTVSTNGLHVMSNIISGNSTIGLSVMNSVNLVIYGNEIGVSYKPGTIDEMVAMGNGEEGATIGYSTGLISTNTISSNMGGGLIITTAHDPNSMNPTIMVTSNSIGTDSGGYLARGNHGSGIKIVASSGVSIIDNIVSANSGDGIEGDGAYGSQIIGNLIGTVSYEIGDLGNGVDGIDLEDDSHDVSVNGNVIVYNKRDGIGIHGITGDVDYHNTVIYNYIGTRFLGGDRVYGTGMGNLGRGIAISGSSGDDLIGNVVASSGSAGIAAYADNDLDIEYNYVGIAPDLHAKLGNAGQGIDFTYVVDSTIKGNAIGASGKNGVHLVNTTNVKVQGNAIGTDATGQAASLGNAGDGLMIASRDGTTQTGTAVSLNTIVNNQGNGVEVEGLASGVTLDHNRIGGSLTVGGSSNVIDSGNKKDGVVVSAQPPGGSTSPTVALSANILAKNGLDGLQILGGSSVDSTNDSITGNLGGGVEFDEGSTNNALLNDSVLSNLGTGIFFDNSPNNTLTEVAIENNTGQGLRIVQSPGIVIKGGIISGNQGGNGDSPTD